MNHRPEVLPCRRGKQRLTTHATCGRDLRTITTVPVERIAITFERDSEVPSTISSATSNSSPLHTVHEKRTGEESTTSQNEATITLKTVVTSARHHSSSTLLKIIPVVIRGATATLSTFALLDERFTITLMEAAVTERVEATGPEEPTVEECDYLADIRNQITYESGKRTIRLGQDNWHLIMTRGVRSGGFQQPAASFTELGWVPHGPCSRRG
ncbi:hypothetical protein EVAR_38020_1 [Eumeta japonica]|uniref:Uncharacterized protein n=1 Tax=Eumeta variegata TaxID=151549 RepID=A0A4C1WYF2_EUMVA|nr:hypothetical protein EVAR_38020_1 [Eumeta japonica]